MIKTALSSPRPENIDPAFRPSNRPTTHASSLSIWLYSVSTALQSIFHAFFHHVESKQRNHQSLKAFNQIGIARHLPKLEVKRHVVVIKLVEIEFGKSVR